MLIGYPFHISMNNAQKLKTLSTVPHLSSIRSDLCTIFSARQHMHRLAISALYVIARPSVRMPSVRLSVTRVNQLKRLKLQ